MQKYSAGIVKSIVKEQFNYLTDGFTTVEDMTLQKHFLRQCWASH